MPYKCKIPYLYTLSPKSIILTFLQAGRVFLFKSFIRHIPIFNSENISISNNTFNNYLAFL